LAFAIEQELGLQIGRLKFNSDPTKTLQNASSFLQIRKIKLQVDIVFKNSNSRFMHSQMFIVKCTYSMLEDQSAAFERGGVLGRYNFLYTKEYAYNSNQEKVKGWSEFLPIREAEISAGMDVFFGNRQEPYHLKDISSTENLIDLLFVELINIVKSNHHISY
jgi:hypothetical protein